jgi:hypothetical protein
MADFAAGKIGMGNGELVPLQATSIAAALTAATGKTTVYKRVFELKVLNIESSGS